MQYLKHLSSEYETITFLLIRNHCGLYKGRKPIPPVLWANALALFECMTPRVATDALYCQRVDRACKRYLNCGCRVT